jgi:hypothetical protein
MGGYRAMNKFSAIVEDVERIDELRDVPVVGWDSLRELISWVKKLGYNRIGSGSYSLVYGKGYYVIKIQHPDMYTDKTMKCNIRFHRIALKSNNPHLPKVYFVKVYKNDEGVYKYVFGTEKLYPIHYDINDAKLPKNIEMAAMYVSFLYNNLSIMSVDDAIEFVTKSLGPAPHDENSSRFDIGSTERDRLRDLANNFIKTKHPLALAFLEVVSLLQDSQCFADLAERNIMQRKDGTIVFADPIADKTRDLQ